MKEIGALEIIWEFGSQILKEIRIENYLRSGNYENQAIKIGNLGNHSEAEFLEINE